jgi:hypothetical protein
MLTWKLWHVLRHPPYQNPVFVRIRSTATTPSRIRQIIMVMLGYFSFCLLFSAAWPYLFAAPSFTLALIVGIANTLYSMAWSGGISAAIAKEHELKTYDLLALQPSGAMGTDWALSTGTLHRSTIFRDLPKLLQVFAVAFIAALSLVAVFVAVANPSGEAQMLLVASVQGIALAMAFYCDHVQSMVLANLIGMITPLYTSDRLNARIWALGGFLLFKLTIYIMTLIINFIALPQIFWKVGLVGLPADILLAGLQLVIFYRLHEMVIAFLWTRFMRPHAI